MDFRKSLSKPLKKLKDKLPGGSRKRDGRSGNAGAREGGDTDIEGREASQWNSYPLSDDVGNAAGSVLGEEESNVGGEKVVQVDDPPTSVRSILHVGEHDSTRTT